MHSEQLRAAIVLPAKTLASTVISGDEQVVNYYNIGSRLCRVTRTILS